MADWLWHHVQGEDEDRHWAGRDWVMSSGLAMVFKAIVIGAGATAVLDLWAMLLNRYLVSLAELGDGGALVCHVPRGRLVHADIAAAMPVAMNG